MTDTLDNPSLPECFRALIAKCRATVVTVTLAPETEQDEPADDVDQADGDDWQMRDGWR